MGFFSIKSQSQKERETAVKNVIAVMLADGKIDPNEMKFLSMVCQRAGISEKELKNILQKPQSIKFTPAKSPNDRMQQLIDMVWMMLADGQIDQREMDMCITLATHLGFKPSAVGALVQHIISELKRNREKQQVNIDLNSWLAE